ncbi:hypothetical protein ABFA07_003559 [Porites harrisoni]
MKFSGTLLLGILYIIGTHAGETNICRIECDVAFTTLGCYRDSVVRTLPNYILNELDPTVDNYGGRRIDWFNWNIYMPGFVCRCAKKAKQLGYDVIGLQHYGECWAGHKSAHNYRALGKANIDECIGDDYQPCGAYDRYCMGKTFTNMVYELVDTECSLQYEKVGCYKDMHRSQRPLPFFLMNDRDVYHQHFSGKLVDWRNWDVYVPDLACRCAKKAKAKGWTFFGLQFYGECWSGENVQNTFSIDGPIRTCTDQCFQPCQMYSKFCVGQNFANFVYKLKEKDCEIEFRPVGCYNDVRDSRALREEIYNEVDPSSPVFGGQLIGNWTADFPVFLCKCARIAKAKGYQYFGVNSFGSCWSDEASEGRYNLHGISSQCYDGDTKGKENPTQCPVGSKLCSGGAVANYVYTIINR